MLETKLSMFRPGESGIVHSVDGEARGLAGRLRDLGFTAGTRVTCVCVSPLGDPVAYRVRGALIALRREDAAMIRVSPCQSAATEGGYV